MEKISLREYFQQLGDLEAPVSYTNLVNLSNLAEEEITLFKKMWVIVPVSRRQQILSRLLEVSEDNLDVNFDRVFYCCISDSDPEIRATAVEGLGESESPDYISVLIKSIEHDSSLKVRIAATMALSKYTLFAEMGRIQASKKRDIERVLIKLVNDTKEDEELRRRALETVSVISIPEAKLLIEKAYGSDSHSMKVSAVFSMGQSCDTSWLPILYKEVSNKDPEIKYEVARALGEMGEQGSVSYLAKLAEDLDPQVAASALDALGKIGGKESRGILEKYRQKGDKSLASAAEDALEYLDEEEKPIIFDYQR